MTYIDFGCYSFEAVAAENDVGHRFGLVYFTIKMSVSLHLAWIDMVQLQPTFFISSCHTRSPGVWKGEYEKSGKEGGSVRGGRGGKRGYRAPGVSGKILISKFKSKCDVSMYTIVYYFAEVRVHFLLIRRCPVDSVVVPTHQ